MDNITAKAIAEYVMEKNSANVTGCSMEEKQSNWQTPFTENEFLQTIPFKTNKVEFKTLENAGLEEACSFITDAEHCGKESRNKFSIKNEPKKNCHDTFKKVACNLGKIGKTCVILSESIFKVIDVWE